MEHTLGLGDYTIMLCVSIAVTVAIGWHMTRQSRQLEREYLRAEQELQALRNRGTL
jgi:hypothetical protein